MWVEERDTLCRPEKNCLQASWPIGKTGGKEDFKDKQQEVWRHTIHLVYSKCMGGGIFRR